MPDNELPQQEISKPELLFSTPIWERQLTDHQRINSDILNVLHLLENEQQDTGVSRSNNGGWHSKANLHQREDMAEITHAIATCCAGSVQVLGFNSDRFELRMIDLWLNRNGPGDLNRPHVHPHSMLSGVYYVKVPPNSGNIEFFDPVLARVVSKFPVAENKKINASTVEFDPVEGRLIIFPSWLQHWVQPNQGEGDRVSISFNVGYRPKKDERA